MDKSAVPTVGVPWLGIPWNRLDHTWNGENAIVISTVLVGMIPTNNCQITRSDICKESVPSLFRVNYALFEVRS